MMIKKIILNTFLFYLFISFSLADQNISQIELPDELNRNKSFDLIHASQPKVSMFWSEDSRQLLIPFQVDTNILLSQGQQTWNLNTTAIEITRSNIQQKIWLKAARQSKRSDWTRIPIQRQFFLALLAIPFAFLCFKAQKRIHYATLFVVILMTLSLPSYQHKVIVYADQTWEISLKESKNWVKWHDHEKVGLKESQLQRPKAKMKKSSFSWIAPDLENYGRTDHLWHSNHHALTF